MRFHDDVYTIKEGILVANAKTAVLGEIAQENYITVATPTCRSKVGPTTGSTTPKRQVALLLHIVCSGDR